MDISYRTPTRHYERRSQPGRKKSSRSINFEEYAGEGNRFINEVAYELGTGRDKAARITRAVLHALRDRLPPDDAVQFAQGLPMALKGIFFDQYDISKAPVIIRGRDRFIDFVCSKDRFTAAYDFPDRQSVQEALRAVFFVLENNMDYGQVHQIKNMLNKEIVNLIEGY